MKNQTKKQYKPLDLHDEKGHLSDSGISLYVEARMLNKEHKLPKQLKNHVSECASCQMRVVDFHQFMKNESIDIATPHPYLDKKIVSLKFNKYTIGRVAAIGLLLVVGYLMLFQNTPQSIQATNFQSSIASPFGDKSIDVGYNQWEMDADEAKVFKLKNGSNIHIPAQAFVNKHGQPVKGKVQIKYREFHNAADIIASGLPMHYDSAGVRHHFESGGMFELRGNQKGKSVYIANDKSVAVNIASYNKDKKFNHYFLDEGAPRPQSGIAQAQILPSVPFRKVYQQAVQPQWKLIGAAITQPVPKDSVKNMVEAQAQASNTQAKTNKQPGAVQSQPKKAQANQVDLNVDYFKLKYALNYEPELKTFVPVKWSFAGKSAIYNPKAAANQWTLNEPWHKVVLTKLPFGFKTINSHKGEVISANYSVDGQRLLTYGKDRNAYLYNSEGKLLKTFAQVGSAQLSKTGKYILTSNNNAATLWSTDGNLIKTFPQKHPITMAVISDNEKHIITTNTEEISQIWTLAGDLVKEFREHFKFASFSPDGKYIATISNRDFSLKIWSKDGQFLHRLKGEYNSVYFSADSRHLLTSSINKKAQLWFFENNYYNTMLMTSLEHNGKVNSAKFSQSGKQILTASNDGTAKLWGIDGKLLQTFKASSTWVNSAEFSGDDQLILTASDEGTARVWNRAGKLIYTLRGHEKGLTGAIFSPDQQNILTFSKDHTFKIWDRNKTMKDVYALDLSNTGPRYQQMYEMQMKRYMRRLISKRPVKKILKKFFTLITMYRPNFDPNVSNANNQLAKLNQQYTKDVANVELDFQIVKKEIRDREKQEAKLFHKFRVTRFGYYNIDRIIQIAGASDILTIRAKADLGQNYTYFTRFYLVTGNRRTGIIRYEAEQLDSFWFAPASNNQLVVVLPQNKVAIFSQADFKKIDIERLKKDRKYIFDLSKTHKVHSAKELRRLLSVTG